MSFDQEQLLHRCRVVVGSEAVSTLRSDSSLAPIVALVDAASPKQAVLAQAAGADIVLPVSDLKPGAKSAAPGLDFARRAAIAVAQARGQAARSARKVSHDIAGALNVIGLAADVGSSGGMDPVKALAQIASLSKEAGGDAWRAGRADRSNQRSLTAVDVTRLVRSPSIAALDVELIAPDDQIWVFADERHLVAAIAELILNARTAGATHVRVEVHNARETVNIVVSDDGPGFATAQRKMVGSPHNAPASSGRAGLGLATITEFASDLGGSLVIDADTPTHPSGTRSPGTELTRVRLSLPVIDVRAGKPVASVTVVDQAATQADILETVVRHAPLAESLDAIVTAIENQLPDTVCSVLLLRDGHSLHHAAGARLPAAYRRAIDGVAIGQGQGSCGTAACTGRPVIATDVTTDRNWTQFRDIATEHGLRSCWSTPIVAAEGGEVLGTFAVYKASVWRPDAVSIKLVRRFTYLAAVAIEHHRLFGAVAESESRFRSAFEGATAGLALVDMDGSLLKVNPSLSAMIGRPEATLLTSNLLDLVHSEERHEIRAAWDHLARGQGASEHSQPAIEVPLAAEPNGERVWVSLSTSIIAAARGSTFYVEVRDITASRRHLAEQRAREAAEASNQAKNDFLALVSHELRTPLNAILGFAQVMQLTGLDLDADQRADSVEQIVRGGEHLRDLIDQLLDLSRIEAGQLSVCIEQVEMPSVICEAIDLVGPLAMSRNISLVSDPHRSDPKTAQPCVLADRRCLRQVLINLLGNAVKYTPANGRVSVEVHEVDAGGIRITVNDTGPGIAPASIDELFQPFHQLEPERAGRPEGTGLGLALTARLMEEMGGTIGVESTVGVGSSFWVEFPPPAANTHGPASPLPTPVESLAPKAPRRTATEAGAGVLLYIEDDEASVGVMRAALELRPSIELRTARTAADGIAELLEDDIDLVLLDIGLPDRSGWDLLRDIRATNPDLPVVVLTAGANTVPEAAPNHDRLFAKPLDIADALRSIDLVLARSTRRDDVSQVLDPIQQ